MIEGHMDRAIARRNTDRDEIVRIILPPPVILEADNLPLFPWKLTPRNADLPRPIVVSHILPSLMISNRTGMLTMQRDPLRLSQRGFLHRRRTPTTL